MRKLGLLIVLALFILAIPIAAQDEMGLPDFIEHTECEVDLTGEEITLYHIGDISSPGYSPITLPLVGAFNDAMAYYNEHGGVCGATFVQENRDTASDPAQTQAAYDAYSSLDPKPDLLVLYSSQDAELLRPQLIQDEIPVLISAGSLVGLYGEDGDDPGWIFQTNPLYADQLATFCDFVAANPEEFPEPVLGYMGWGGPLSSFGLAGFTPESEAYCESVGVDVVDSPEAFDAGAADISGNVENILDQGANIIYVNALAPGFLSVGAALQFLGELDNVKLAGVNWGMDTSVPLVTRSTLGDNGLPVVDGMYGSLPFRWWTETDVPGIQFIIEQADANERETQVRGITYILGWLTVDTYTEIYIQTANRVGSLEDITGADIKETIESMDYRPLGGVSQFVFEEGSRAVQTNRIVQMRFANETMDGIATSGEDALAVPLDDGTNYYPPVIVPRTEFGPAPDMRPGMMEDEG